MGRWHGERGSVGLTMCRRRDALQDRVRYKYFGDNVKAS